MSNEEKKTFLEAIIELVEENSNLVVDQNETPHIEIVNQGQQQVISMFGQDFQDWLRKSFYDAFGRPLRSYDIKDAIEHLSSMAKFSGRKVVTALRLAYSDNNCYIDLGNEKREVMKITKDGYVIDKAPAVYFIQSKMAAALPIAQEGGDLTLLRDKYLNLGSEESWILVTVYLVAAFFDLPSKPFILLNGEQGSSKSTTTRLIRELIDPSKVKAQTTPSSKNDLLLSALNNALVCIDNASKLSPKLMDIACQLCTGAGFSKRRLYTDTDLVSFEITRLLIINGIDADIITAPDLLSRCIQLILPAIDKSKRVAETQLWKDFASDKPKILGALYDLVSKVLAIHESIDLKESTRLTDFCRIGVAVETVLGWEAGAFMAAMNNMQSEALAVALDYDSTASAIMKIMKKQSKWKGTAEQLLSKMNLICDLDVTRDAKWPRSARALGIRLVKITPALREQGIFIEKTKSGDRMISITAADNVSSKIKSPSHKFEKFVA
ncbi:hypothetical protein [Thalassotalea montiporae]